MSNRDQPPPQDKDRRIAELEAELAQAQRIIAALGAENEKLRAEIEELKRTGKRQATPFARRERKTERKRAGRKTGRGQFARRAQPCLDEVKETRVSRLNACPCCGGELSEIREHEQFEIDIPPVQPVIIRYVTYSGYCAQCQQRVRSQHPDQISTAAGAAGVVIGPRAKALATDLKHRLGVSYGKISELFHDAFGLPVTRSGWCQADQRLAQTARPVYEALLEVLRQCTVVHGDETGWRIGVLSAWLWVFTNEQVTAYTIETNRSHTVIVDILGQHFAGVLVSDCFLAYDHRALADWLKQKCIGHLLQDLKELTETKTGRAICFAREVTALLQAALALKKVKETLPADTFAQRAADLEARLDVLIDARRHLTDADNRRLAKRLRKHRPHLLRFLYVEELDATNNRAERMLRPAVMTRKTGGCNRTEAGADAHAILSSLLVTCRQHSIPILDYLVKLQRFGDTPPPLPPPQAAPT